MKPRSSNTGYVPMPSRLRRELRGPLRVGEPRELRALCGRCGHHECSCAPRAVAPAPAVAAQAVQVGDVWRYNPSGETWLIVSLEGKDVFARQTDCVSGGAWISLRADGVSVCPGADDWTLVSRAQPAKPRTWRDETTPEPFVEGVG